MIKVDSEKKKKLLVISNSSGGLYGFRKELLSELLKTVSVSAAVPNTGKEDELRDMGVDIIDINVDRRGVNPFKDLTLLINLKRVIRTKKPDLVITYTIKPNIYGGIASKLCGVDYAANITGLGTAFQKKGVLRSFVVWLNRIALKKAKVVFFENSHNKDVFVNNRIIKEEQSCLLNGAGVNIDHFSVRRYPDDIDEFRFLFIGRIMKEKGFLELIRAIKRMRNDGVNCSLSVLGGFEEENLKDVVDECSSEGWLNYHGIQADVRPFIEDAHCFVLPSYHEGMANTNLECAACGRPVITSNIPGCKEAVLDGVSGYLCEPQNEESLYDAMVKMSRLSRDDREAMGIAGRHHVERVFDKRIVVKETIDALMRDS